MSSTPQAVVSTTRNRRQAVSHSKMVRYSIRSTSCIVSDITSKKMRRNSSTVSQQKKVRRTVRRTATGESHQTTKSHQSKRWFLPRALLFKVARALFSVQYRRKGQENASQSRAARTIMKDPARLGGPRTSSELVGNVGSRRERGTTPSRMGRGIRWPGDRGCSGAVCYHSLHHPELVVHFRDVAHPAQLLHRDEVQEKLQQCCSSLLPPFGATAVQLLYRVTAVHENFKQYLDQPSSPPLG